jgi:hypothetical protein
VTGLSAGLAISSDNGETFSANGGLGTSDLISEFIQMGSRVYAAVRSHGLWVSADSGQVWQQVPIDTLNVETNYHVANSLATLADTLIIGTDAGLVNLTLDAAGDIIASSNLPIADTDSTGAQVVRIRHQTWSDDYFDHTILWTVQQPMTEGGIPAVGRYGPDIDSLFDTTFDTLVVDPLEVDTLVDLTFDTLGFSWSQFRKGANTRDLNFFSDTVFVVGDLSVWFSPRSGEPTNFFSVRQFVNDTLVVANLDNDTVTAMVVRQDTVIFTTYNGLAISTDRGQSFSIYRPNLDPLTADVVINHTFFSSNFGLAGNFIPAIGVQYQDSAVARIWAGARPADFGGQGISVAEFDDATGALRWQTVLIDDFAWNFEFIGDTVLAATNNGLLMGDSQLDSLNTVWETISFTDMTSGEVLVEPGTSVFGVEKVGQFVWVGTDDGTVRIKYSDFASQKLFQRVDSTTPPDEVYAFPVPFRPNRLQSVDFHYTVVESGTVTLEIYDFAMNLVATPIDNVYHAAAIYPDQGSQGFTWDGLNDRGDLVAVGVYYFKVEFESGETRWGKLAVIP